MQLSAHLEKARNSTWRKWLLNMALQRMIPFNAPHGIRITEIHENGVRVDWPYKKRNLNHIKGLHACGLATLAEFTTGLSLLRKIDTSAYRLIMKSIQMDYFYQGKTDAYAEFHTAPDWYDAHVKTPVNTDGMTEVTCEIHVMDVEENKLATGRITWQIKSWEKVKTKLK